MNILGISCYYHDSAAALVVNGRVIAAAAEERFSRKKNDSRFPEKSIQFCLEQADITRNDLDAVVFYEKPLWKFHRILFSSMVAFPGSLPFFISAMRVLFSKKLWIKRTIIEKLDISPEKIYFVPHHIAHAAASYFCSPYRDAAIVTIDGVGEWTTTAIGQAKRNTITILKEQQFPHSLGLLYSAFTAFLGFEINEGEYKVMGMAPFGKPRYINKVRKLVTRFNDGSFKLNLDYFSFHISENSSFSNRFISLFGKPRLPGSLFFTRSSGYPSYFGKKTRAYKILCRENQRYADIASSIQAVTEEIMLGIVQEARRLTDSSAVCLSGGVFLNSSANGKIARSGLFDHIIIQPAAGDSGGAVGAALYISRKLDLNRKRFVIRHAQYGKAYTSSEIKKELKKRDVSFRIIKNNKRLIEYTADQLIKGRVIGWMQGRFEWGPRALGNRSILADPRSEDMKDMVNTKIKFREPYRPFAASCLKERGNDFFDLPEQAEDPLRYMLYVVPVKKNKISVIPAVTHINYTCRPQMVERAANPLYYALIEEFYRRTRIPMILNTSFNVKGEPIVNSPADAIETFLKSGLDVLVAGNYVVEKKKIPH